MMFLFQVMGRFLYKAMHDDNWGEHELDYVIILRNFDVEQISPNPEEVESIALVSSMKELTELLKSEFFFKFLIFEIKLKSVAPGADVKIHFHSSDFLSFFVSAFLSR